MGWRIALGLNTKHERIGRDRDEPLKRIRQGKQMRVLRTGQSFLDPSARSKRLASCQPNAPEHQKFCNIRREPREMPRRSMATRRAGTVETAPVTGLDAQPPSGQRS